MGSTLKLFEGGYFDNFGNKKILSFDDHEFWRNFCQSFSIDTVELSKIPRLNLGTTLPHPASLLKFSLPSMFLHVLKLAADLTIFPQTSWTGVACFNHSLFLTLP